MGVTPNMKPTVYLESSVVSYFANEISADLKVAAEQRITSTKKKGEAP